MLDPIHKGIDWRQVLTVLDSTGAADDLTGLDIKVQLKRHTAGAALVELTPGAGITLRNQTMEAGLADIQLDAATSTGLESASHYVRVLIEDQVAYDWTKVSVRD